LAIRGTVILKLDYALGWDGVDWKGGAVSQEVRKAENIPSLSPGLLFKRIFFKRLVIMPSDFFVNYLLCEFEFAYDLNMDFPNRGTSYSEAEIRAAIECLMPVF
jgi:2-keto-4-pentenoate hydratase